MAVRPPSKDELAAIARGYGMHLSEEDLGSFEPMVAGLLSSYEAVEDLYAQIAPQPPAGRIWKRPESGENPLGAWYVKTEIQEQPEGPLAGRRVAVKDNIEVAGVPMMNGSRTLEGFVPGRDATVVTRLLAAGARITGKAVCEDLCFSGASHTSVTGPVRLREAGMQVEEVSVPWHRHAMHVWNVIATDGATVQMVDGNGYGYNWDGLYDPELIAFYGRQRGEVADAWSETVKLVVLGGRFETLCGGFPAPPGRVW